MADIIILNGTSSAGKSTLAKALQAQFDTPYLHAGIDNYIFMLPKKYLNPPLWDAIFHYVYTPEGVIDAIETGEMGQKLISAMHHSVKALADAGFNVIVDHVILDRMWLPEMAQLFSAHRTWLVGVLCPLVVVEQREKERKDRTLGQARAQYDVVHAHVGYDYEVDTSLVTPEEAAEQIAAQMQLRPEPTGIKSLNAP